MGLLGRAHVLMKDNKGAAIVSALIGFGIASLFRKACVGNVCKVYIAPDPESVAEKQFQFDGSCYEYSQQPAGCSGPAHWHAKEDPAALLTMRPDPASQMNLGVPSQ